MPTAAMLAGQPSPALLSRISPFWGLASVKKKLNESCCNSPSSASVAASTAAGARSIRGIVVISGLNGSSKTASCHAAPLRYVPDLTDGIASTN
jgi:hypothetical protein